MRPDMITTGMFSLWNSKQVLLNENDIWPILGDELKSDELKKLIGQCSERRLPRNWGCLEKAILVAENLKRGTVEVGSFYIWSSTMENQYGFEFNPPFEFHAWVRLSNRKIIDIALPGVIETGLNTCDQIGPYLIGREPIVLAGDVPSWLVYETFGIYTR